MQFEGKVVLVTGGGRGIGRYIALAFAREGADTVIVGRNEAALEQTAKDIRDTGRSVLAVPMDISISAPVSQLFEKLRGTYGRLDVLVNNAAIEGPTAEITEVTDEQWDEAMAINIRGTFLCTRAAVPLLKETRGSIIILSSLGGGVRGYPLRLPYATSKAACKAMGESLAVELGPYGIRVNTICPGPTYGDRMDRIHNARAKALNTTVEAIREGTKARSPLRRITEPEEVADCALWLASDAAASITAQSINLTCGLEMAQ